MTSLQFHVRAAATGNARSPTVDSRVGGTSNVEVEDDRRRCRPGIMVTGWRASARPVQVHGCTGTPSSSMCFANWINYDNKKPRYRDRPTCNVWLFSSWCIWHECLITNRPSTSTGSGASVLFVFSTSSGVFARVPRLAAGARTAVLNAVRGYTPFLHQHTLQCNRSALKTKTNANNSLILTLSHRFHKLGVGSKNTFKISLKM